MPPFHVQCTPSQCTTLSPWPRKHRKQTKAATIERIRYQGEACAESSPARHRPRPHPRRGRHCHHRMQEAQTAPRARLRAGGVSGEPRHLMVSRRLRHRKHLRLVRDRRHLPHVRPGAGIQYHKARHRRPPRHSDGAHRDGAYDGRRIHVRHPAWLAASHEPVSRRHDRHLVDDDHREDVRRTAPERQRVRRTRFRRACYPGYRSRVSHGDALHPCCGHEHRRRGRFGKARTHGALPDRLVRTDRHLRLFAYRLERSSPSSR